MTRTEKLFRILMLLIVAFISYVIYIKWDKVHGKKRKAFKYVLKQSKKRVYNQYKMWNKYCGRDDVLYIHCRLGAGNWFGYDCDTIIKSQPWFLDCVEDSFDRTYLDVYAKIGENQNVK